MPQQVFPKVLRRVFNQNQLLSQRLNRVQRTYNALSDKHNALSDKHNALSDKVDANNATTNAQIAATNTQLAVTNAQVAALTSTTTYSPSTASWTQATINLSSGSNGNSSNGDIVVGPIGASTTTGYQLCAISNLIPPASETPTTIYISTDYGQTWNSITNSYVDDEYLYGLAVSGDGSHMTYNVTGNITYCSTDSGQTWTSVSTPSTIINQPSSKPITTSTLTNPQNWIAISNNGQYQTAASLAFNLIYVYNDSSSTWNLYYDTILTQTGGFSSVAMTGSGAIQVLSSYFSFVPATATVGDYFLPGGSLYISNNYGITSNSSSPSSWLQITSTSFDLTNQIWVSVAINSSSSSTLTQTISAGQYITALSLGTSTTQYPLTENNDPSFMLDSGTGYMYTSANGGNSWTQVTSMGTQLWESVSMSSTGQYQTAVTGNGLVYVSSDYGSTWALNNNISVNSSNTTGLATGSQPDNICMSSNGYNQSLSIYWVSNGSTNTSGSIYYSNYST